MHDSFHLKRPAVLKEAKNIENNVDNMEKKQEKPKLETIEKTIKTLTASDSQQQSSDSCSSTPETKSNNQADSTAGTQIGALGNLQLLPKRHDKIKANLDNNNNKPNTKDKDYFKNIIDRYENIKKGKIKRANFIVPSNLRKNLLLSYE